MTWLLTLYLVTSAGKFYNGTNYSVYPTQVACRQAEDNVIRAMTREGVYVVAYCQPGKLP